MFHLELGPVSADYLAVSKFPPLEGRGKGCPVGLGGGVLDRRFGGLRMLDS